MQRTIDKMRAKNVETDAKLNQMKTDLAQNNMGLASVQRVIDKMNENNDRTERI